MTDYSKLTDDELDARIAAAEAGRGGGAAAAPRAPAVSVPAAGAPAQTAATDYSSLSDEELDARLAAAEAREGELETLQEMHPDFTPADRLVVKNFSANNEAAVNYLQRKHPNLEISVDDSSGQIKARARDGKDGGKYRVLDPDLGLLGTLTSPGELARDLGDVGYDAAAALGTGAATAASGIAGAAAGGVGALPVAAAGGAAASTGFEGLRQGLGRLLGMEDNFDASQLAGAAVGGAASPLLFGTGGQVGKGVINQGAQALGKRVGQAVPQLGKYGVAAAADDAALQAAQRGAVGRGWDAFGKPALAKVGAAASGASAESLKTLGKHYDKIRRLEQDPEAITNFTREAAAGVGTQLRGAKKAAWSAYEGALETAQDEGATVAVSHVSAPLKDAIARAADVADETKTEASRELLTQLKGEFKRLFTYVEQVPQLDEAGQPLLDEAGDVVTRAVRRELDELSPAAAARLEGALSDLGQLSKLKPDRMGVGNRFGATQSADDKAIATIGAEMKKLLGESLEETLGGEALAARAQYGKIANLEKRAAPLLKNPSKAFSTLRNADKTPNATTAELFGRLDRDFGTDLVDRAKIMDAYSTFAKPSSVPLSAGGSTSTSRSIPLAAGGAGLGYWLGSSQGGEGRGSGVLGGLAGGLAGGFLGSPAMMRRAIAAGIKGGQLNQGLGPLRPGVGGLVLQDEFNPWLGIKP